MSKLLNPKKNNIDISTGIVQKDTSLLSVKRNIVQSDSSKTNVDKKIFVGQLRVKILKKTA